MRPINPEALAKRVQHQTRQLHALQHAYGERTKERDEARGELAENEGVMNALRRQLDEARERIAELEGEAQGYAEELNEALNHNDETCEAVKHRMRLREGIEKALDLMEESWGQLGIPEAMSILAKALEEA